MLMAASPHSSKLEDILVPGPNITPQQERRNSSSSNNNNSNKAANNSQPEQSLKCPRCDSTNTKFCYYNNYSLSQPRYFCKSCRRYWTKGGTLRNVPVGGGLRKNRRPSSSSSSSSTSKRSSAHIDPQFSAVSAEANSIPLIVNGFHMDLGLSEFRGGPEKRFDVLDHDLSFLGSLGLGVGAASSSSVNIPGFLEYSMMRNGLFHETQHHHSSFENFYQGLNNGATATATATATGGTGPKQEMESGLENENRVLWGFPWNGSSESEEVDSGRSGNGGINTAATNWNGLVYSSPLMM